MADGDHKYIPMRRKITTHRRQQTHLGQSIGGCTAFVPPLLLHCHRRVGASAFNSPVEASMRRRARMSLWVVVMTMMNLV